MVFKYASNAISYSIHKLASPDELYFGEEKRFMNFLELYERVLPLEWHSFCISIDNERALVYHNGNRQGVQNFSWNKTEAKMALMNSGVIGGAKFIGILADLQVFGSVLSDKELSDWTLCQIKEKFLFIPLKSPISLGNGPPL